MLKVYHRTISVAILSCNLHVITFLIISLLSLTGCTPIRDEVNERHLAWHYSDLRKIDPADAVDSFKDIIAIYIKDSDENLGIRLDLLDMKVMDQQEIYIGIDFKPDGSEFYSLTTNQILPSEIQWDILLKFPTTGDIGGYDSRGKLIKGIKARVFRDPSLDMISISISKLNMIPKSSPVTLEVLITDIFSKQLIDRAGPVNSKALPPTPAKVSFIFWNTFEAYTPADALRSWDGAHSGPLSNRHGLRHLLDNAEENGISIILLDVNSPSSRSAMEFLDVYPELEQLAGEGFLGIFGGLSGCDFEYMGNNGYAKFKNQDTTNPIPIDLRREFIHAALDRSMVLVGTDFSDSIWGNPLAAASAFNYIKNHPWINASIPSGLSQRISAYREICEAPSASLAQTNQAALDKFHEALNSIPENDLKELARQTYSAILHPANTQAYSIADNYFWQLGHILSAADWYKEPFSMSSCSVDIDWDGQDECVLSSKNMYLTFELNGGYLAFSFISDAQHIHQITAPMSETMIGLGDPITYDASDGAYADPALTPGAAINIGEIHEVYSYKTGSNFIELSNSDMSIKKLFRITEDRIQIDWETDQDISYTIPLNLDPWLRFDQEWSDQYLKQSLDNLWKWGIKYDIAVQIESSIPYQFHTFLDSKGSTGQSEDPNYEYPRGHYLPFPYAIIQVSPTNSAHVEIRILKP